MDTISKKILLSAGIGLGVAVSGVSLYLLFKPEMDSYSVKESDRRKIRQSTQSVVTLRVPKQFVGAVIGRGGEQIKRIQCETKTRINFDDSNTNTTDSNGLKEIRILLIKGTPENTAKAEVVINDIIREQSMISTKHFNVETTAIGGIIGRNGENIRSLCEKSGAKIKVDSNSKNTKAIMTSIWVTGTDEQIEEAVLLINKEISQNQSFSRNRFQNNFSQKRISNYKLLAIEDNSNDRVLDLDTYFAKLEPINHQLLEVFVSAVNSPDQFYVQLTSSGALLDHLMEDTTDFYENDDNRIAFKPLSIKVGDIVTIPYQFDEHWYRAKVLSIEDKPYSLEDSKVGVFYLDYGDDAILKYNQICDLKDELLKRMPFQAIECSLSGITPKDKNKWSEEAILKFREMSYNALWKKVFAKVIDIKLIDGKREKYVIELIDKQTSGNNGDDWDDTPVRVINIGQELIRQNLALPNLNQ